MATQHTQPPVDADALNRLYEEYTRRELVHPDPLEFLYDYPDPQDREIVALIASSMAYGRVRQILKSVRKVLNEMDGPRRFVEDSISVKLRETFSGFTHRWTDGEDVAGLLSGIRGVTERHGSLQECFESGLAPEQETVHPALCRFTDELTRAEGCEYSSLLPDPSRGSASKRLHLFLRWMVRRDPVDPGGWDAVDPALLLVPLDVHMQGISRELGLTDRKQANLKTTREVTAAFRAIAPEDPVKYDFALSRLGIRHDEDPADVLPRLRTDTTA